MGFIDVGRVIMKRFFAFLILAALLCAVESQAQTYGGGSSVTGTNFVYAQSSLGNYVTNVQSYNQPARALLLSGITTTNENVIGYYGFVVPSAYPLLPGTSNVFVTGTFTNNFNSGTNGGSWSTNLPGVFGQQVNLLGVMALAISGTNSAGQPLTNTATASP